MHSIVLCSIVLRRSQFYCIVNLLLRGYNTIQYNTMHKFVGVLANPLRVVPLAAKSLMLIGWTEKKSLLTQAQRARSSQSFHSLV